MSPLPWQLGENRQIWIKWNRPEFGGKPIALIEGEDRWEILPD
jgi:hypothetical protein